MKFSKIKLLPFLFFIGCRFFMGFNTVANGRIYESGVFNSIMTLGYNDNFLFQGIVLSIVISLILLYCLENNSSENIIVGLGRIKYIQFKAKELCLYSLLYSAQYILADVIFCVIFVDFSVLIQSGFFIERFLLFLLMFLNFFVIGTMQLMLRILFNGKKIYTIINAFVFCGLVLLISFKIYISPSCSFAYISKWYYAGTFNFVSYVFDIAKMIVSVFAIMLLSIIIFNKKDIIENEK